MVHFSTLKNSMIPFCFVYPIMSDAFLSKCLSAVLWKQAKLGYFRENGAITAILATFTSDVVGHYTKIVDCYSAANFNKR